ncbi:hypothetical protein EAF04_007199 [Stromatinia cepivora]|nr:hypothetical protein EAF04_007199 [Stromatinia cepivora]
MPMHTSTTSVSTLCHNKLRLTGTSSSKLHFPEQLPLRIKANLLDTNAVHLTLTMCCFGITSSSSPLHSRVGVPPRVITHILSSLPLALPPSSQAFPIVYLKLPTKSTSTPLLVPSIIPTTHSFNPGTATIPIIVEPYTHRTMVPAPRHSSLPQHASHHGYGLPGLPLHHGSRMHHGGGFGGGHRAPFLIVQFELFTLAIPWRWQGNPLIYNDKELPLSFESKYILQIVANQ